MFQHVFVIILNYFWKWVKTYFDRAVTFYPTVTVGIKRNVEGGKSNMQIMHGYK